jgi:hypothetical protein
MEGGFRIADRGAGMAGILAIPACPLTRGEDTHCPLMLGTGFGLFDSAYALLARLRCAALAGPQARAHNAALPAFSKGAVTFCGLPPRGHTKGCRPLGFLSTIIAPCGGRSRPLARAKARIVLFLPPPTLRQRGSKPQSRRSRLSALKGESHVT